MLNSPYTSKTNGPRKDSTSGRIRAALTQAPGTAKMISERTGIHEVTVKGLLSSMASRGQVSSASAIKPLVWSLTDKGRRAVEA